MNDEDGTDAKYALLPQTCRECGKPILADFVMLSDGMMRHRACAERRLRVLEQDRSTGRVGQM